MPYYYSGNFSYFLLLIPAIILTIWAQIRVKSAYKKFSQVGNSRGMTGAQAARAILDANGLYDVEIVPIAGNLTDNYNPKNNVVSLSEGVYNSSSVAAIGIAAHEVGHAIQHSKGYIPVKIRSAMVPAVNFGSRISWILIMVGLLIEGFSGSDFGYYLAVFGVILFSLATIFHLVTLPVEYNASRRAKALLGSTLAFGSEDIKGVRKVLNAAALTYVAALAVSLINLLRVISMVSRRR